jgi:hypothetical protein
MPITPDTLFQIASITQTSTAIAVLQQWEAGKIDLSAPVTYYLPWFPVRSDPPITVHHLLCHTAGIEVGSNSTVSTKYQVAAVKGVGPPGITFSYSNAGYDALGCILEAVTGRRFAQVIQEGTLDPLGLEATELTITLDTYRRLATGYRNLYDDRPRQASHPWIPASAEPFAEPSGCIASTVMDLGESAWMLLNGGLGRNGRVLSEEGFYRLTQRSARSGEKSSYGYGVYLLERDGDTWLYHSGGAPGYRSLYLVDAQHGVGVVALANARLEIGPVGVFAMRCMTSMLEGRELPAIPEALGAKSLGDLAEYAGTYRSPSGGELLVRGEGEALKAGTVPLSWAGRDTFLADYPGLDLFPFRFGRQNGAVVELSHGPDWYVNARHDGPTQSEHPPAWEIYTGHYRASHSGTFNNFRVILRKGQLLLIRPEGIEEVLAPLSDGVFRTASGAVTPAEQVTFDTAIDGRALRASIYGSDFYRVSDP